MWFALRSSSGDATIWLKAGGAGNLWLGPGTYQVYSCIYPDGQPTVLKGGTFDMLENYRTVLGLTLSPIQVLPPGSVAFSDAADGAEFYFTNDSEMKNRWVKRAHAMAVNLVNGNTARIPNHVPVFVED